MPSGYNQELLDPYNAGNCVQHAAKLDTISLKAVLVYDKKMNNQSLLIHMKLQKSTENKISRPSQVYVHQ